MSEGTVGEPARRVVIGTDTQHKSAVVADARDLPAVMLPGGIRIQEIWRQLELPARPDSEPDPGNALGPTAPTQGVVIRLLTLPGTHAGPLPEPHLHTDEALHVFTVLAGRLTVILEHGTTALDPGDSVVFRGNLHDLRNDHPRETIIVYTSFPLTRYGNHAPDGEPADDGH